jgi:hypothetical protein
MRDARVIRALDLLITVDTMTAHLAGALGVPVWNVLCADADWELDGGKGRLAVVSHDASLRQTKDWEEVISRVASELRRLDASRLVGELTY